MAEHTIEFHNHHDFADTLGGQCVVAVGIGPRREAILLAVDPENQSIPFGRDEQPGGASFARSKAEHPYPATVFRLRHSWTSSVDLLEVDATFPLIQPLADDNTLIVSARCPYRNGNPEQNATIYDQHGQAIRRMVLGDGIEDVQVARDQRIWVSYFDEGVIGNRGWPYPLGADGLLCFNADGQIVWRFHAPGGFDPMVDCYALNVANDAVWVCYHADFPVVRITAEGAVQGWENKFRGARALVVDRQRILLWGGYGEERNRCIVQTIAGERIVSSQRLNLSLPNEELPDHTWLIGRDSILHAFVGTTWYQLDLRDLPIA